MKSRKDSLTQSQNIGSKASGFPTGGRGNKITESMRIIAPGVVHRPLPKKIIRVDGGAAPVTSFTDDFNRTNTSFGFGRNYVYLGYDVRTLSSGGFGISSNKAAFTSTLVNTTINFPYLFVPIPLITDIDGLNQYSQFKWVSANNANAAREINAGSTVLTHWTEDGQLRFYMLYVFHIAGSFPGIVAVDRYIAGTYANLYASSTNAVVANDTVRMEVVVGGSSNSFTIKVNGSTLTTFSDNNANRPTLGYPGFGQRSISRTAAPGVQSLYEIDDFACGTV